ncbi:MAG: S-layer homology domain-containing protein, partial [Lachnospirales bacterium]
PENFDFKIETLNYNEHVDVTYDEKDYNLTIIAESLSSDISQVITEIHNISLSDSYTINIQDFNGFEYRSMHVGENTDESFLAGDTFKPTVEGDYVVILDYDQLSNVNVDFVLMDGTKLANTKIYNSFVNEEIEISVPQDETGLYDLTFAYIDGVKYNNVVSGITYNVTLKKIIHNVELVYSKVKEYEVEILSSKGGYAVGDGLYYEEEEITATAFSDEGYEFSHWEEITHNAHLSTTTNYITDFEMPAEKVTLRAVFVNENNDSNTVDNSNSDSDSDDGDDSYNGKKEGITTSSVPIYDNNYLDDIEEYLAYERLYKPYVQGYPDNTIKPDGLLKRQEVVQIIYNLYALEGTNYNLDGVLNFSDIDIEGWYSNALAFCVERKIINGYTDGTFRPDDEITRGELATILAKLVVLDVDIQESNFIDLGDHWAKDSINVLYTLGIVKGYEDGSCRPDGEVTRAELVTLVNRLINRPKGYLGEKTFKDLDKSHWAFEELMNASNGGIREEIIE